MQLKNSLLNKALIRKDLTRFWPVWTIELVLLFFLNMMAGSEYDIKTYGFVRSDELVLPLGLLAILFSIITATMLFGYLADRKEAYLTHSFPIKRQTLFWSHYISGFLMVFLPELLFCLYYFIMMPDTKNRFVYMFLVFLQLFLGAFASYNLACVSTLLTANKFSGAIIYLVLNVMAYGVMAALSFIAEFVVYGNNLFLDFDMYSVPNILMTILTPLGYYSCNIVEANVQKHRLSLTWITPGLQVFFIVIPAVLLLLAAYYLFKKRDIETAGDMVAFSWAKPVYKAVFTFFFSVILILVILFLRGFRFFGTSNYYSRRYLFGFALILSATLGYFVVTMIMERKFFIWKRFRWYQYVLPGVCTLALLFFVKLLGGFYPQMPETGEVDYIEWESAWLGDYTSQNSLFFSEAEDVKTFMDLNRQCIREQKEMNASGYDSSYSVNYHLKNGSTLYRTYSINTDTASVKRISDFCMEKNRAPQLFFEGRAQINSVDVYDSQTENWYSFGEDEMTEVEEVEGLGFFIKGAVASVKQTDKYEDGFSMLYEAIKEDEAEGNLFLDDTDEEVTGYSLEFNIEIPVKSESRQNGEEYEEHIVNEDRVVTLSVKEKNVHTMEVVESMLKEKDGGRKQ